MSAATAPSAALTVCVVVDRGRRWALPVAAVSEVADLDAPLPLPRCPAAVIGLGNLRGQAVAVVDLGTLLVGDPPRPPGRTTVAVVRLPGAAAGLAVERVEAVLAYDALAVAAAQRGDPPACVGRLPGEPPALLVSTASLAAALVAARPARTRTT